ncbi:MAG TPA: hypothetical protein VFV93_01625 [Thermomicrobiales bacterium]|nr:hypothetical protein [Thermomicrobiales bacterium]
MTFRELPRWMRIWIVLAFILIVVGLVTCVALGTTSSMDVDY